jgi:pre-mRNA-splicing factor 38B
MEQYGNEHYNVERVLRENINGHEYMRKTVRSMSTWDEVVDEIYRAVDHVEPWMSGNIRGPSSAFCLLYRLFELKLTEEQIQDTITCKDSVYIRAVRPLVVHFAQISVPSEKCQIGRGTDPDA